MSLASGAGAHPARLSPEQSTPAGSAGDIQEEDFASLWEEWLGLLQHTRVNHIFFTPYWVAAWWHHLGSGELRLLSVRKAGEVVGVIPLVKRGQAFLLAADKEVCDYADVVVRQGEEAGVASALLDYLTQQGTAFCFSPLLPHSPLVSHLAPLAEQHGYAVTAQRLRTAVRLDLPPSWEEYLNLLTGKERHEVRRKLRRLYSAGEVSFYPSPATPDRLEEFFSLFRASRADKAEFLTPEREAFLRTLARELEARGYLQLYFLEVSGRRIAAVLGFEYDDTFYLYNNGFDPAYAWLSAGLMSKVLSVQEAIQRGKLVFDFLSGAESYKLRLGGREIPLFRLVGKRPASAGREGH